MKSNFQSLIESDVPVLIDFHATWCGPCKVLAPILKEVKDEMGESLRVLKIDVDKNANLSEKYQVRGVPTLILFQHGKQLWRQSGVLQRDELISIINSKVA
ncbi:thioredoxin [Aureisphaera sp.]